MSSRHIITFSLHGNHYEITVAAPTILRIHKTMEDSGICRDMQFDELSQRVQERILSEITNHKSPE